MMFLVINSCGKSEVSKENKDYLKAKQKLDSRDYKEANRLFEKLTKRFPENRRYKQFWADSFLGMGGFELFEFLSSLNGILSKSFESDMLILEFKKFTQKYFFIGDKRKSYLIKALQIYSKLSDGFKKKTREDKLKKGLVHIFLVTQALKTLVEKVESDVRKNQSLGQIEQRYKSFVKKYLVHVDEMIFHAFRAYLNLKESFDEVNSLLEELDRAIYVVFGIPYNIIKDELKYMNIEKFVELFIKYNPKLYEEFMKRVLRTCKRELALKRILFLENEIKESYRNHEFQSDALKVVRKVKEYVKSHNQDICHSLY